MSFREKTHDDKTCSYIFSHERIILAVLLFIFGFVGDRAQKLCNLMKNIDYKSKHIKSCTFVNNS